MKTKEEILELAEKRRDQAICTLDSMLGLPTGTHDKRSEDVVNLIRSMAMLDASALIKEVLEKQQ